MKRTLLIGKTGQIGLELSPLIVVLGECLAVNRAQLDLSAKDDIAHLIRDWRPDIVINAAAYTAVDKAENDDANAMNINARAPEIMASECKKLGALLVHYSTDYVFDGTKESPYVETDATSPINAYGRSKLAGEQAILSSGGRSLILRTSWVYGMHGQNFLRTILKLADERDEIRVVNDQLGIPNWSHHLAMATMELVRAEVEGLYHLSAKGETTWFGFAKAILQKSGHSRGKTANLIPIATAEYPLPASRPASSRLSANALIRDTGLQLDSWEIALNQCLTS